MYFYAQKNSGDDTEPVHLYFWKKIFMGLYWEYLFLGQLVYRLKIKIEEVDDL